MTDITSIKSRFDPTALRSALGCFPTGVAVVTTLMADRPLGLTISSFNSVSLDPPLVLWSLSRTAWSLPSFKAAGGFVINVLSAEQSDLARQFSRAVEDRFAGVDWWPGQAGRPVLCGAAAVFECRIYAVHDGGDHEILLGEVMAFESSARTPLVFGQGRMGPLHSGAA